MTKEDLKELVAAEIRNFHYEVPHKALGKPWPEEKVQSKLEQLRNALVEPYQEAIELDSTEVEPHLNPPRTEMLWVVADDRERSKVVYHEATESFGLAVYGDKGMPTTVGVWGDLVGTFMAK